MLPPMATHVIETAALEKRYGSLVALNSVDLRVLPGAIGLLGGIAFWLLH